MRHRMASISTAAVSICLLAGNRVPAGPEDGNAHLTIYDGGVAEFLEERTVPLQPGLNSVEWRCLMPKALLRTLRVTAEGAEVVRQDVTYDGVEVRNGKSPVLHLSIQNKGAAGARRVRVDYLAPDITWQNDYSFVLDPTAADTPPTAASLDAWVSVLNQTGTDVRAGTVDLVAGEIKLLQGDRGQEDRSYAQNVAQRATFTDEGQSETTAESTVLSAFSRFRLGSQIVLNANAPVSRLPLFQRARLRVDQRLVFENDATAQTLARGGFNLLPRGLEVRLVARNTAGAPMPAGQVTIYARSGELAQIVGQDRIGHTPVGGEFTVSQGRSTSVLGTRRVLERRSFPYRDEEGSTRQRLVTKVEVVIVNRGGQPAEVVVREGIEPHGDNRWTLIDSSAPGEPLGANIAQFKLAVPAGARSVLSYQVETK